MIEDRQSGDEVTVCVRRGLEPCVLVRLAHRDRPVLQMSKSDAIRLATALLNAVNPRPEGR